MTLLISKVKYSGARKWARNQIWPKLENEIVLFSSFGICICLFGFRIESISSEETENRAANTNIDFMFWLSM